MGFVLILGFSVGLSLGVKYHKQIMSLIAAAEARGATWKQSLKESDSALLGREKVVEPLGGGRVKIKRSTLKGPWVWRTTITTPNAAMKQKNPAHEFEDYQNVIPLVGRVALFRDEGAGKWTLRDLVTVGLADPTIATFQAEESKDHIIVDLDQAFHDLAGPISVYEGPFAPKLPKLRIKSSTLTGEKMTQEKDAVFLRRIVELDVPRQPAVPEAMEKALAKYARVRLDHAFHPYQHADGFVPRLNNSVRSFYENPPVPDASKGPTPYVHRHDENREIVFAMPADTPKDRADDMETAARYWNEIFDKVDVKARVKLEKLPAGVDPFLTNKNTIEFRTVFAEGATGRGINQTDALTGRILKSNVHVSSVFTDTAASEIGVRWARVQAEAGKELSSPPPALVGRAVSDYYVDTFAHEIGHTLGLRHNFAGNLSSPLDGPAWTRAFDAYVTGDVDKSAVFTSSIMEYLPIGYAMMLGAHIRKKHAPFSYDVAVIRTMYAGQNVSSAELGPFCEKEEEPTYADCQQNDMGPTPLTDFTLSEAISDEAIKLALQAKSGQDLIVRMALDPSKPDDQRERRALVLGSSMTNLLSGFRAGAQFVRGGDATARQKQAYAALTGDLGAVVKHVIDTKGLDDADVKAISGKLRTKLLQYLAAGRITVAPVTLDRYFAAFEADFAKTVRESLRTTSFASLR